jgi:hypothetical protein
MRINAVILFPIPDLSRSQASLGYMRSGIIMGSAGGVAMSRPYHIKSATDETTAVTRI